MPFVPFDFLQFFVSEIVSLFKPNVGSELLIEWI